MNLRHTVDSRLAFATNPFHGAVAAILMGSAFLFFVASVPVAIASDCWKWVPASGPNWPEDVVFDEARGVAVARAGVLSSNEIWEWNGSSWTYRMTGNSGDFGGPMVYDPDRGVTLVIDWQSGEANTVVRQWDGVSWTSIAAPGPPERRETAAVYDRARGVVVLFGGNWSFEPNFPIYMNDTWEWDGVAWTQRILSPTPLRNSHSMVFDSARGVTVLFGGRPDWQADETWEYDGTAWALRDKGSIGTRLYHGMAYDSARGVTVLHGGAASMLPTNTLEWDGATWRDAGAHSNRLLFHSMAYDTVRARTLIVGGRMSCESNSRVWEWDGFDWTVGWETVSERSFHALAFDRSRSVAVMFGGVPIYESGCPAAVDETWELTPSGWMRRNPANRPALRRHGRLTYDDARAVSVLFGGDQRPVSSVVFGDTWEWDGLDWSPKTPPVSPPARTKHGQAYDSARGVTVVFGGDGGDGVGLLADTWEWDGATWSQRVAPGPSARSGVAMAYDASRQVTVLFGGSGPGLLRDTWEWNGVSWSLRATTGPSPRHLQTMMFDSLRSLMVMTGDAIPAGGACETWEWDGVVWRAQGGEQPEACVGGAGYFDDLEQELRFVGGAWDDETGSIYSFSGLWLAEPLLQVFAPVGEEYPRCSGWMGFGHVRKNRYLSIEPPHVPDGATGYALRVMLGPMPGPDNCPGVGDFSALDGAQLWVGDEVMLGGSTPTGVYKLTTAPVFRDWTSVAGGVVHVSDCHIVPCASYTVDAITDTDYPGGPYSPAVVLGTSPVWGDITGAPSSGYATPPDGGVSFVDISAVVSCFGGFNTDMPRSWCDLAGSQPTQGLLLNPDFADISAVVTAFQGLPYPFAVPATAGLCP